MLIDFFKAADHFIFFICADIGNPSTEFLCYAESSFLKKNIFVLPSRDIVSG